jgi:hypothetical protein
MASSIQGCLKAMGCREAEERIANWPLQDTLFSELNIPTHLSCVLHLLLFLLSYHPILTGYSHLLWHLLSSVWPATFSTSVISIRWRQLGSSKMLVTVHEMTRCNIPGGAKALPVTWVLLITSWSYYSAVKLEANIHPTFKRTSTRIHLTVLFIVTAVRNSNPIYLLLS